MTEGNPLLKLLLAGCTEKVQPNDSGYGRRLKVAVGQQLDTWHEHRENLAKWYSNRLKASERSLLLTRSVAVAVDAIDAQQNFGFSILPEHGEGNDY